MIFVAGHKGMVGSAILRALKKKGEKNILYKSSLELDLTNQKKVASFFKQNKITQIYIAAAKVGGIFANNKYPADFIYKNLMIQTNIINSAFENNVKKILFLGSSCIYPVNAVQPMAEKELLTGLLEQTNEPYAISKIAGIKLCESYNRQYSETHNIDYRSVMPTNLYGPGDNYNLENSHVIPALIRKFHEAKLKCLSEVSVWGSGNAKREFLHVDDLASACIHIMNLKKSYYKSFTKPMLSHINVGSGRDVTIKNLSKIIKKVVGYKGKIEYDLTKPDGPKRKLMDSSLINSTGWVPKISLENGLKETYQIYLNENI